MKRLTSLQRKLRPIAAIALLAFLLVATPWAGESAQTGSRIDGGPPRSLEQQIAPQACPPGTTCDMSPKSVTKQLMAGAYITMLDDFNLLDNNLSVEFFFWTRWHGSEETNPSDRLAVLNGPSNNDIDRFELLDRKIEAGNEWRLYKVRSRIAMPWRLQSYPFDRHLIHIRIGPNNPLAGDFVIVPDRAPSAIDPELILYDWSIGKLSAETSAWSLKSNLGSWPEAALGKQQIAVVPTFELNIPLARRSELALLSSFLGDFLAIGLCMLSLIIPHSRDDLILGAVFSAAGNSIFLAQLLPISALSGFTGSIQLIIYLGILYVIIADELLDRAFRGAAERFLHVMRPMLLPSYVLGTLFAIYRVIPSNVIG